MSTLSHLSLDRMSGVLTWWVGIPPYLGAPTEGRGIIARLSSPGTTNLFTSSPTATSTVSIENGVLSAPEASLEELSEPLTHGIGATAAGSVAKAVVPIDVTLTHM